MTDPDQKKAAQQTFQQAMNDRARQAAARSILQALYAPDQLRERMMWFWFNHFSVHQYKANLRVLVGDYEDRAIRPYALGTFRDLMMATLHHPAMLRYLDNADNAAGHINENYAREIMELHTMGVGSGYAQSDVEELARILTGVGIDLKPEDPKLKPELQPLLIREGAFEFNPARHDYGDKMFLGHLIKGRGSPRSRKRSICCAATGNRDAHLATARDLFRHRHAAGGAGAAHGADLPEDRRRHRRCAATMIHAPEFAASLKPDGKFKDPVHYVFSAVRLAYDDKVILNTAADPELAQSPGRGPVQPRDAGRLFAELRVLERTRPDDGAVRDRTADRLRLVGPVQAGRSERRRSPGVSAVAECALFQRPAADTRRATLAALDQAISPQDWNTLFLSSPEFMR